jgi:hypothetical protein
VLAVTGHSDFIGHNFPGYWAVTVNLLSLQQLGASQICG